MPSLQHAIATKVVPFLRRNPPVDDLAALRDALVARNRTGDEGPPSAVRRGHEEQIDNVHGFPVFTLWKPGGRTGNDEAPRAAWSTSTAAPTCAARAAGTGGSWCRSPTPWVRGPCCRRTRSPRSSRSRTPSRRWSQLVEEVAAESPDGFVLAGDSAGGGYALAVAQALRDRGGTPARRASCCSPPGSTSPARRRAPSRPPSATRGSPTTHLVGLRVLLGRVGGPGRARRPAGEPGPGRPGRSPARPDVLRHP